MPYNDSEFVPFEASGVSVAGVYRELNFLDFEGSSGGAALAQGADPAPLAKSDREFDASA